MWFFILFFSYRNRLPPFPTGALMKFEYVPLRKSSRPSYVILDPSEMSDLGQYIAKRVKHFDDRYINGFDFTYEPPGVHPDLNIYIYANYARQGVLEITLGVEHVPTEETLASVSVKVPGILWKDVDEFNLTSSVAPIYMEALKKLIQKFKPSLSKVNAYAEKALREVEEGKVRALLSWLTNHRQISAVSRSSTSKGIKVSWKTEVIGGRIPKYPNEDELPILDSSSRVVYEDEVPYMLSEITLDQRF